MDTSFTIRNQACPNEKCKLFQMDRQKNVLVHSRKFKRFRCNECRKTWVIHLKEIRYRLHRSIDHINLALALLQNGLSTRQVSRRVKVSPSTIQRWKNKYKDPFLT